MDLTQNIKDDFFEGKFQGLNHLPFQHPNWIKTWQETVGKHNSFETLYVKFSDNLFIPFILKKRLGLKILSIHGEKAADYIAPYLGPEELNAVEIFKTLKQKVDFDLFYSPKVPAFINKTPNPFLELNNGSFGEDSHQLEFNGENWEIFYQEQIKTKVRKDIRRQIKRLEGIGTLKFVIAQNEKQALEITKKMILQKESRYQEWGVPSIFALPGYKEFYLQLAKNYFQEEGNFNIHISALYLDDEIISTHWGVANSEVLFYMLPSFDTKKYEKYSPGKIHLSYLAEWAYNNKFSKIDFTVGDEGYKSDWCNKSMTLYNVYYPANFKGYLLFLAFKIKEKLKQNEKIKSFLLKTLVKLGLK